MADEAAIPLEQRLRELKEDVEFSGGMGAMMSVTHKRFSVLAEACLALMEKDQAAAVLKLTQEVAEVRTQLADAREELSALWKTKAKRKTKI